MSPAQNSGGPFKGFTPYNAAAAAAPVPRKVKPVAAVGASRSSGGSSTLSIVALILSILGLGCPIVGIAGAICGIIAMRLGRNGLALAAVIIGSLATLLNALALALVGLGVFKLPETTVAFADGSEPPNSAFVRQATMQEAMRLTEIQANEISRLVLEFQEQNRRLPDDITEVTAPFGRVNDAWGTEFQISVEAVKPVSGESTKELTIAFILTAGPDRTWGTADDYVASSAPYVILDEYGMKSRP